MELGHLARLPTPRPYTNSLNDAYGSGVVVCHPVRVLYTICSTKVKYVFVVSAISGEFGRCTADTTWL